MGIRRLLQRKPTETAPEPEEKMVEVDERTITGPLSTGNNVTINPPIPQESPAPPAPPADTDLNDDVIVYKDKSGEYRWHRVSSNGSDIVSESGQGYQKLSYAMEIAREKNPGIEPRFVLGVKGQE